MVDRRVLLAAALSSATGFARIRAAGAEPAVLADAVMARLAALPSRSAPFVEEKSLPGLSEPLVSSGHVVFVRPSRLEQVTEKPKPEHVVIDGDTLSVTLASGETTSLRLSDNPPLGLLAATLRATLDGDIATIRRLFVLEEQGNPSVWRLELMPKDNAMRRFLARVTVDGREAQILQIVIQQADGGAQRLMLRDP
jgi:outer membrane lipoprotein-sorting protein